MSYIEQSVSQDILNKSKTFQVFRNDCKKFLANNGLIYDKFSITPRDSELGYISERTVKEILINKGYTVRCWEDNFDIKHIQNIINNSSQCKADIEYVKEYFYDKFDLYINDKEYDVKTAETKLIPNESWTFNYPVIQANKHADTYTIILTYFNPCKKTLQIIGKMTIGEIKKCPIGKKGALARNSQYHQIDNYITKLNQWK